MRFAGMVFEPLVAAALACVPIAAAAQSDEPLYMRLPIAQAQGFDRFAEALAARRGHDPDLPPHLAKVMQAP